MAYKPDINWEPSDPHPWRRLSPFLASSLDTPGSLRLASAHWTEQAAAAILHDRSGGLVTGIRAAKAARCVQREMVALPRTGIARHAEICATRAIKELRILAAHATAAMRTKDQELIELLASLRSV
jgi:hypothetical protein